MQHGRRRFPYLIWVATLRVAETDRANRDTTRSGKSSLADGLPHGVITQTRYARLLLLLLLSTLSTCSGSRGMPHVAATSQRSTDAAGRLITTQFQEPKKTNVCAAALSLPAGKVMSVLPTAYRPLWQPPINGRKCDSA